MSEIFLRVINLSIMASWLILAVVILRPLLKKAPKWISCALWALVAVRLICPFSFESIFSLIPSSETIPYDIEMKENPAINSGITAVNNVINPMISQSFTPQLGDSANPLQIVIPMLSAIWLAGVIIMLAFALISYIRLKRSVGASICIDENVMTCDDIKAPFVLGVFKPVIYLPSSMKKENLEHVISHEKAHIKRHDNWWKPLGYLLLAIYWFNPLCWLAYVLLCRDIEMACDEKVISSMDNDFRAEYSQALLNCSLPRKRIAACPLAFGEVGVKTRVKTVLNYKKPAFWIIIVAFGVCIMAAVCFLTKPISKNNTENDNIAGKYVLEEGFWGPFVITLEEDGSFIYCEGLASSYIGAGDWHCEGDTLVLNDINLQEERKSYFRVGKDSIYFDKEKSVPFMYIDLEDGTEFKRDQDESVTFYAKILEIQGESFLVEPVQGSSELNSADRIVVPMKNMLSSPEPQVGDMIEIKYSGVILETYPAQLEDVYQIKAVGKGSDVEDASVSAAKETVEKFFNCFETADYEAMREYCTKDFQDYYYHDDNVFGMVTAKLKYITEETGDDEIAFMGVEVEMETAPASALYPDTETYFYVNVIKADGKWLVDSFTTG